VFLHDLKLALRSLLRTPGLTALTAGAIACGIGATMVTLTLYHARAGHPIWWKEDQLFAVTLDTRGPEQRGPQGPHPEYPPFLVTYRDAKALYRSAIPTRSVMMFRSTRVVEPQRVGLKPFSATVRVTTADFFPMFDVPFLYGAGWARAADEGPDPVVVLGRHLNDKLFGGADSVGKLIDLSGHEFRVVGVIDNWMPQPKFYDLNTGSFDVPEDLYMPFGWTTAMKLDVAGNVNCVTPTARVSSFNDLLTQDCVWLQYWVEMPTVAQQQRFQAFVDNYVRDQKQYGRFIRPLNNRIVNVTTWLAMNNVIGDESRLQVGLAGLFLAVCILNTLGLMLAKFLSGAPVIGLRRALGASRRDIVRQHLTEVVVIGVLGGFGGIALSWLGLAAIRLLTYIPALDDNPGHLAIAQALSHMDVTMLAVAVLISVLTGIVAGLYPAWRIGRMEPALFLKSQ